MRKLKIIALVIAISCGSLFAVSKKIITIGSVNPAMANPSDSGTVYLPLILTSVNLKEPTVFGVESHKVVGTNLNRLNEVGTYWIRRNGLLWSEVEKTEGVYDWTALSNLEQEMINASRNGLKMILVVRSTPTWAQQFDSYFCGPIKPEKLGAFGDFMYAAVQRYSQAPYNVKYWQMWNEPDAAISYFGDYRNAPYGCWGNETADDYGGGYYADMLQAVYPRIIQADDEAQVVLGGLLLSCPPEPEKVNNCHLQAKFLEGVLEHNGDNDGKNYFDITAIHAYDYYLGSLGEFWNGGWASYWNDDGPVVLKKSQFIKGVLGKYGALDKKIMVTENALLHVGGAASHLSLNPHDYDQADAVIPPPDFFTTKTYYIAKVYATSIAEGFQATIWYDLSTNWAYSSLLNRDLTYTDAFWAFQTAKNSFGAASFVRQIIEFDNVMGYEFDRGDRIIWLIWSKDGSSELIYLPSIPLSAWDVLNKPVEVPVLVTDPLQVGLEPVYLEWLP